MVEYPVLESTEAFARWKVEAQVDPDFIEGYEAYVEEQKQLNLPISSFDSYLLSYFQQYI